MRVTTHALGEAPFLIDHCVSLPVYTNGCTSGELSLAIWLFPLIVLAEKSCFNSQQTIGVHSMERQILWRWAEFAATGSLGSELSTSLQCTTALFAAVVASVVICCNCRSRDVPANACPINCRTLSESEATVRWSDQKERRTGTNAVFSTACRCGSTTHTLYSTIVKVSLPLC